ncbi:MAG: hypothetical protein ACFFDY_00615 [Candidatus Thorarchaeota archaeon]
MKRISMLLVIFAAILFLVSSVVSANGNTNSGPGNNNGGGNPNPPGPPWAQSGDVYNGDIFNTFNTSYNSFLYEYYVNQSYDFSEYDVAINDQRQYISVDNTPILEALQDLMEENTYRFLNDEADSTLGAKYGEISSSTVYIPKSINIDPNIDFGTNPNIHLNPTKKVVQLRKGEFCSVQIAIISDINAVLKIKCSNPNVKVITKEIIVLENTPAIAEVQLYFKSKAAQWEYAFITFEDALTLADPNDPDGPNKELSQKSMIVFENKEALDWKMRFTTNEADSTAMIGVSQNKTTWGWGLSGGMKTDRHGNNMWHGVFEIDL